MGKVQATDLLHMSGSPSYIHCQSSRDLGLAVPNMEQDVALLIFTIRIKIAEDVHRLLRR